MRKVLNFTRSLSIATALIFGVKPLTNGIFELNDFIFPIFMILAVVSHVLYTKQTNEKKPQ